MGFGMPRGHLSPRGCRRGPDADYGLSRRHSFLDGVYPANAGYAVVADEFIQSMKPDLRTSIPPIAVGHVAATDPLVLAGLGRPASSLGDIRSDRRCSRFNRVPFIGRLVLLPAGICARPLSHSPTDYLKPFWFGERTRRATSHPARDAHRGLYSDRNEQGDH